MFSTEEFADALFDGEVFDSILRRVADAAGARSFLTGWYDSKGIHQMTWDSGWWPADQLEIYSREWAYRDVWSNALLANWKPNIAWDMATLVSDQTVENSELYNEFFRPMGDNTFHGLAIPVGSCAGKGAVALHRGRDQARFQQHQFDILRSLEKPLARLVEMRGRFSLLQRENATISDGIDQLGHAIFFIRSNRRLLRANLVAEQMLQGEDLLRLRDGALEGVGAEFSKMLESAIVQLEDPLQAGSIELKYLGSE